MKKITCIILTAALLCFSCSFKNDSNVMSPDKSTANPSLSPIPNKTDSAFLDQIAADSNTQKSATPLQTDDNSYYIISADLWSGNDNTITIINNKGEVVHRFHNVLVRNLNYAKINKNTPLIIGLSNYDKVDPEKNQSNFKYGLYLPGKDRFIIEPKYEYIQQYGNNLYGGTANNLVTVFDLNGKVLFTQKTDDNYYLQPVGDYIWYFPYSYGNTYVYDQSFNQITEIDQSLGMHYPYGSYVVHESYIHESDNSEGIRSIELLDAAGKVFLSKDILIGHDSLPDNEGTILSIDYSDGADLYHIYYGQYQILLDKDFNKIDMIDMTEEPDSFFAVENETYYKYKNNMQNSGIVICNSKGDVIKDAANKSYTNTLGQNKVYRIEDSTIEIYNYLTKSKYTYNLPDYTSPTIFSPFEDVYLIRNGKAPFQLSVFNKNTLIFNQSNYIWSYTNYQTDQNAFQVIYPYNDTDYYEITAINTIINKKGEIVYTSPYEETIYSVDENYILVKRGNYIGLVDFSGKFVYKIINPELGDD